MEIHWISTSLSIHLGYKTDELNNTPFRKILDIDSSTIMKIATEVSKQILTDTHQFLMKNGQKINITSDIGKIVFEDEPYAVIAVKESQT